MRLSLLNYVVGLGSFWNLAAPAIALVLFLVGLLCAALAKRPGVSRAGVIVAGMGVLAFLIACGVDAARNVHDVNELESAAHERYALNLNYAEGVALFGSGVTGRPTVAGRGVTAYGSADVLVAGKTVTVSLDRLSDGSFVLTSKGRELPITR